MSQLSTGRLAVFDIRRNASMFWVTNFADCNLTRGEITRIDALRLHTDMGVGIVPIHFRVVAPFRLYGVDFIDLDYHAYTSQRSKNGLECALNMVIRVSKLPTIRLIVEKG